MLPGVAIGVGMTMFPDGYIGVRPMTMAGIIIGSVSYTHLACHTGNRSCFFTTLAEKEYKETNPLKVFEEVFGVILDRKEHPKEGSYTNYLFDKGIDKILKKLGEMCIRDRLWEGKLFWELAAPS